MTLGIEFPPLELNVDMGNPKVHAGTTRIVYKVIRSPTEPDAIDTGRSWQAATYQHARLGSYSTKARLPAATSSRQIEATKYCLASRASTVCQGQPKKHAKQTLPSGNLLGFANGNPSSKVAKQRLPSGNLLGFAMGNPSSKVAKQTLPSGNLLGFAMGNPSSKVGLP